MPNKTINSKKARACIRTDDDIISTLNNDTLPVQSTPGGDTRQALFYKNIHHILDQVQNSTTNHNSNVKKLVEMAKESMNWLISAICQCCCMVAFAYKKLKESPRGGNYTEEKFDRFVGFLFLLAKECLKVFKDDILSEQIISFLLCYANISNKHLRLAISHQVAELIKGLRKGYATGHRQHQKNQLYNLIVETFSYRLFDTFTPIRVKAVYILSLFQSTSSQTKEKEDDMVNKLLVAVLCEDSSTEVRTYAIRCMHSNSYYFKYFLLCLSDSSELVRKHALDKLGKYNMNDVITMSRYYKCNLLFLFCSVLFPSTGMAQFTDNSSNSLRLFDQVYQVFHSEVLCRRVDIMTLKHILTHWLRHCFDSNLTAMLSKLEVFITGSNTVNIIHMHKSFSTYAFLLYSAHSAKDTPYFPLELKEISLTNLILWHTSIHCSNLKSTDSTDDICDSEFLNHKFNNSYLDLLDLLFIPIGEFVALLKYVQTSWFKSIKVEHDKYAITSLVHIDFILEMTLQSLLLYDDNSMLQHLSLDVKSTLEGILKRQLVTCTDDDPSLYIVTLLKCMKAVHNITEDTFKEYAHQKQSLNTSLVESTPHMKPYTQSLKGMDTLMLTPGNKVQPNEISQLKCGSIDTTQYIQTNVYIQSILSYNQFIEGCLLTLWRSMHMVKENQIEFEDIDLFSKIDMNIRQEIQNSDCNKDEIAKLARGYSEDYYILLRLLMVNYYYLEGLSRYACSSIPFFSLNIIRIALQQHSVKIKVIGIYTVGILCLISYYMIPTFIPYLLNIISFNYSLDTDRDISDSCALQDKQVLSEVCISVLCDVIMKYGIDFLSGPPIRMSELTSKIQVHRVKFNRSDAFDNLDSDKSSSREHMFSEDVLFIFHHVIANESNYSKACLSTSIQALIKLLSTNKLVLFRHKEVTLVRLVMYIFNNTHIDNMNASSYTNTSKIKEFLKFYALSSISRQALIVHSFLSVLSHMLDLVKSSEDRELLVKLNLFLDFVGFISGIGNNSQVKGFSSIGKEQTSISQGSGCASQSVSELIMHNTQCTAFNSFAEPIAVHTLIAICHLIRVQVHGTNEVQELCLLEYSVEVSAKIARIETNPDLILLLLAFLNGLEYYSVKQDYCLIINKCIKIISTTLNAYLDSPPTTDPECAHTSGIMAMILKQLNKFKQHYQLFTSLSTKKHSLTNNENLNPKLKRECELIFESNLHRQHNSWVLINCLFHPSLIDTHSHIIHYNTCIQEVLSSLKV